MKRLLFLLAGFALLAGSCSRTEGSPDQSPPPVTDEIIIEAAESDARELPKYRKEWISGEVLTLEETASLSTASLARSIPDFFEHFPSPEPVYPVKSYRMRYKSRDWDGKEAIIVAQVFVPVSEGSFPLYVFASGTTGIGDNCAPSLEVPEKRRWGWYTQNMLAYATLGHIVIFPDYTGFNDAFIPQRYFSKLAEGRMMLDAIRAIKSIFPLDEIDASLDGRVFTAGYSQGGHAAMAAADLLTDYAPELHIDGIITYGSTNDVEALVREGPAYAPLIFYSYMSMYGGDEIQPALYLREKWMPTFEEDASTMAVDIFQVHYGFDYRTLYKDDFAKSLYDRTLESDYPALFRRMAENHTGLSGHGVPALVIQGDADFIVTTGSQEIFVNRLRDSGSDVEFKVFPDVSHRYTRMAGFVDSVRFMATFKAP